METSSMAEKKLCMYRFTLNTCMLIHSLTCTTTLLVSMSTGLIYRVTYVKIKLVHRYAIDMQQLCISMQ